MPKSHVGRPKKAEPEKRLQLHISMYKEDLEKLDSMTKNRSDFLRQCIEDAWQDRLEDQQAHQQNLTPQSIRWIIEFLKVAFKLLPHRAKRRFIDEVEE